jgi:LysM repeat protein
MALRSSVTLVLAIFIITFSQGQSKDPLPRYQQHYVLERETPSSIAHDFNIRIKDFLMLNNFPADVKLKTGQKVLIRLLKEGENAAIENPYVPPSKDWISKEGEPTNTGTSNKSSAAMPKPSAVQPSETKSTETKAATTKTASTKSATTTAVAPEMLVGPNGAKYEMASGSFHVVQKGQTFYHIALMYHLTMDELKKMNNMTTTDIKVGQELRVSK